LTIKVFNEKDVAVFFHKLSLIMEDLCAKPPESSYPTDAVLHCFGGEGGKDFHFGVAVVFTTNKELAEKFLVTLKEFSEKEMNKIRLTAKYEKKAKKL
jgi:hypothetical protein